MYPPQTLVPRGGQSSTRRLTDMICKYIWYTYRLEKLCDNNSYLSRNCVIKIYAQPTNVISMISI